MEERAAKDEGEGGRRREGVVELEGIRGSCPNWLSV